MAKKKDPLYDFEEIYEYYGSTETQLAYLMAGITYPDPSYEIKRKIASCFSIEYVYEGEGVIQEDSHIYKVSAGDFFILHPGCLHHYYANPKNPWKKIFFAGHYKTDFLLTLLKLYGINNIVYFGKLHSPVLLEDIMELLKTNENNITDQLEILIFRMVLALSNHVKKPANDLSPTALGKEYINSRLMMRVTVSEVAKYVNLDYSYFSRAFKKTYGITPSAYILRQKLELSKALLSDTTLSVHNISDKLAFFDTSHFSHAFTEHFGISPAKFRETAAFMQKTQLPTSHTDNDRLGDDTLVF